jgi:hypothetical protein
LNIISFQIPDSFKELSFKEQQEVVAKCAAEATEDAVSRILIKRSLRQRDKTNVNVHVKKMTYFRKLGDMYG